MVKSGEEEKTWKKEKAERRLTLQGYLIAPLNAKTAIRKSYIVPKSLANLLN